MLFMVIETFRNQDAKAAYRRFRDKGRMLPDRVGFVSSYVTADLGRCFQLMEADDVTALSDGWRNGRISRRLRSSRLWPARTPRRP
jgi:hypothetical protein